MEATSVARAFVDEFVSRFGVPVSLHTDQRKYIESAIIKEICQLLGVKKTWTTPYHPQPHGLMEIFNRTVLDMVSMAVQQDEHGWDLLLPLVMLAYRTSVQETTGTTPFSLMFGHESRLPEDIMFGIPADEYTSPEQYSHILVERVKRGCQLVRDHAEKKQRQQKDMFDRKVKGHPYHVNELVFYTRHLLFPKGTQGSSADHGWGLLR